MRKTYADKRVKQPLFPLSVFALFFVLFALLTTAQMMMIGQVIDYRSLPPANTAAVLVFWVLASLACTLVTGLVVRRRYQRPVEELSEAARRVAGGIFRCICRPGTPPAA